MHLVSLNSAGELQALQDAGTLGISRVQCVFCRGCKEHTVLFPLVEKGNKMEA